MIILINNEDLQHWRQFLNFFFSVNEMNIYIPNAYCIKISKFDFFENF